MEKMFHILNFNARLKIVQLRFATDIFVEQYIEEKAWKDARLDQCPLHPEGGCKLGKHGTYSRKSPDGAKIARWYCPDGRTTFGLLPDCLSSRLSGTLIEVETVINQIEGAPSQEAAADNMRPDIGLPGILRWMRHRLFLIRVSLILLIDLMDLMAGDITLRSKRELIKKFIKENLPKIDDHDAISEAFEKFWQEQKILALGKICENEDQEQFKSLIDAYIFSGQEPLREDVFKCLAERPSILQARRIGEKILGKMKEYVQTFIRGLVA